MKTSLERYMSVGLGLIGTPYIYGGRDRSGVDCSGLVILSLYEASIGGIDLRKGWWTDRLWKELPPLERPQVGCLAFYGGKSDTDVEHVMVVLCLPGHPGLKGGAVLGATGGGQDTTAPTKGALVTVKPGIRYRRDFRGFRSVSLYVA